MPVSEEALTGREGTEASLANSAVRREQGIDEVSIGQAPSTL
jgi:hypothetical protein